VGALAAGCDVVAVGRTHELHPGVLARRLSLWGARVAADGTEFGRAGPGPEQAASAPSPAARTLVLGPASSGKSAVAEDLLAAEPEVVYAATGPVPGGSDPSWAERVAAHRARRSPRWVTDETGDLARLLTEPGPPLLVDALGTWVAATMDRAHAWEDAPGWRTRTEGEVDAVIAAWRQARRRVVAVGEEVGWGIVPVEPGAAAFREVLGDLLRRLAAESEQVVLVVAGRVVELA
jgi:adenosylcobinamide kinase/adenosylcobinamide-phosphate guanylyltransferase